MLGQFVGIGYEATIAEVALKCGDPFFKDFPKNIYSQAVYRANRHIAKRYKILDRIWTYTNTDGNEEIDITPLNFNGEWLVTILPADTDEELESSTVVDSDALATSMAVEVNTDGSYTYKKKKWEELLDTDTTHSYAINYIGNRYVFKYTGAAVDDTIKIYYVSSIAAEEDFEEYDDNGDTNILPVLPNKYHEESIRKAVLYMAQLGIAKFEGDKGKKYQNVLRIYTLPEDRDSERGLERERPWIVLKTFISQYP